MFSHLEPFDCLVLGDEVAGLDLISKLHTLWKPNGLTPRIGLIRFKTKKNTPIPIPLFLANKYGLQTSSERFSPQILTPDSRLPWNLESLKHRFPCTLFNENLKGSKRQQALQEALNRYPELLHFSSGVWNFLSRSLDLPPHAALNGAMQYCELTWWNPNENMGERLEQFDLSKSTLTKIDFQNAQHTYLHFSDGSSFITRYLIFNSNFNDLIHYCKPCTELEKWISLKPTALSPYSTFPLTLTIENCAIANPVSPLSIYFTKNPKTRLNTSVYALELSRQETNAQLTLWHRSQTQFHLAQILEEFRHAVGDLTELFPFLPEHLLESSLPFSLPSQTQTAKISVKLKQQAVERYNKAGLFATTRKSNLFFLSPHLKSHLPYPEGPLGEVPQILERLIDRKTFRSQVRQSVDRRESIR